MQQNRFKAFSDSENEQSDDEVQHSSKQNRPVDPRSRAEKRNEKKQADNKKTEQVNEPKQVANDGKRQKFPKEQQKEKGVSADPHPLDKHSGQAYKSHDRKGGAGKGNWGTYKDDIKELPKDAQEPDVPVVQEQPEEEQLTLQEYFAKFGVQKQQTTVQQPKGNQDYTSFLKEGCQVIEKTEKVDDKNPTKKKTINDVYIGMQNTDLLGFRTGLKTYALREERPREERTERTERPQRQHKEETQKVEGEQQTEANQENKPAEQKQDYEKKPYRNNRDNRENRDNRDNRDGGRQNNRGGYKGGRGNKQQGAQKANVNLEDDSLFPKLG